jgi:hypothetical protein
MVVTDPGPHAIILPFFALDGGRRVPWHHRGAVPSKAPWMVLSLQVLIQLFFPSTIACLSPQQSIKTVVVAVAAIAAGRGSSLRASGSARVGRPARG